MADASWKEYETAAMKRALKLAARGRGKVEPNPMVGACIVKGKRVVAEGLHRRFGGPHAETAALARAGRRATKAEMFVTLEPCSHHAKTPPCVDAIIAAGLARVVVAMRDPFKRVRGRGIERLRKAGVRVDVGLLKDEAKRLNAPFVKLRTRGLPWFIAKYAMTLDGNIAAASGHSRWISSEASREIVHRLRARVDAILIGIETALADDPLLTPRPPGARTPARIVLDSRARLGLDSKLVASAGKAPLIVVVAGFAPTRRVRALAAAGADVIVLPGAKTVDVGELAQELGRREMTNVVVEGGAAILGSFFEARLIDEVMIFVAPRFAGEGISAVRGWTIDRIDRGPRLEEIKRRAVGPDTMIAGRVVYPRRR